MFRLNDLILLLVILASFKYLYPSYAIAALLLSGISTGVVAPFISNLVQANSALVLVMVVTTSLFAPFSLPILLLKIFYTRHQRRIFQPGLCSRHLLRLENTCCNARFTILFSNIFMISPLPVNAIS